MTRRTGYSRPLWGAVVVSRGSKVVRPGFAPGTTAFEMALVETGRG